MVGRFSTLRSSLFDEFWRLHQEIGGVLGDGLASAGEIRSLPRGTFPAINVVQSPDEVQIYVFLAGVDPKQLNLSVQRSLLTISGRRAIPNEKEAAYYRQERFEGEFHRTVSLGDDLDPNRVEAKYRDGILHIKLFRRESTKPRQIEIH